MNSDLSLDDDRQDVSATVTSPINSKSDVRRPISETRQHDRRKIRKKLKIMMKCIVIMIAGKRNTEGFTLSYKWKKATRERGILSGFFGRTSTPRLLSLGNKVEYMEE